MVARRPDITDGLIASLDEAAAIAGGERQPSRAWHPPAAVDVRTIREGLGLSQPAFARGFGSNLGTVQEWEQGRRARSPETMDEAMQAGMPVAD